MQTVFRRAASAFIVMIALCAVVSSARADSAADAKAALTVWWGALVTGTPAALDPVLAPEFQIMRADGTAHDKKDYLASALPKVAAIPQFSHMAVTAHGDLLITRYWVTVNETRNGKVVVAYAPRLTVFRREGKAWLVSAHANFATLEK